MACMERRATTSSSLVSAKVGDVHNNSIGEYEHDLVRLATVINNVHITIAKCSEMANDRSSTSVI
jgi:predicted secreted protein